MKGSASVMKKAIIIFISLLLIFSILSNVSFAASTKVKVSVNLKSIECVKNNHVGNEWGFGCTVNKMSLDEEDTIEIETTSNGKITIVCRATEDDSIPDTGSKTLTIPVSKLKAGESKTYTSQVTVKENRGRYSGNTAVWKFTFDVKR